jgi:hypothetical protein
MFEEQGLPQLSEVGADGVVAGVTITDVEASDEPAEFIAFKKT